MNGNRSGKIETNYSNKQKSVWKKTIAESKIRLDWVLFVSIEIQLDKQTDNKKDKQQKAYLTAMIVLGKSVWVMEHRIVSFVANHQVPMPLFQEQIMSTKGKNNWPVFFLSQLMFFHE